MEINVENYLNHNEIKEIVQDELRNQVRQFFKNEQEAQRLLSNLSYQIVFNEIDKVVPNSHQLVVDKTMEVLNDIKSFSVFRDGSYGSKSAAYVIMETAVRNNVDLINEKVKETIINKDYSEKIWETFENLADTFITNIYEITRLGREKSK
jgi:hypothetical protein